MLPKPMALASALYVGETVHARRKPAVNRFVYSLFMGYLDLDELQSGALDCWPIFSSKTSWCLTSALARDHLIAETSASDALDHKQHLDEHVRTAVQKATGSRPNGPIRLLTGLRVLGCEFNPVSFFYVFSEDGSTLEILVAEVNNIPWFEQHLYVLTPCGDASSLAARPMEHYMTVSDGGHSTKRGSETFLRFSSHDKVFHVSPFMPLQGIRYDWLVEVPAEQLRVRISLREDDNSFFMASLDLSRRSFNPFQLIWLMLTYPFMTLKVIFGIMYEAAKLWLHGAFTFYPHPAGTETPVSKAIAWCVAFVANLSGLFHIGKPIHHQS